MKMFLFVLMNNLYKLKILDWNSSLLFIFIAFKFICIDNQIVFFKYFKEYYSTKLKPLCKHIFEYKVYIFSEKNTLLLNFFSIKSVISFL